VHLSYGVITFDSSLYAVWVALQPWKICNNTVKTVWVCILSSALRTASTGAEAALIGFGL